MAVPLISIFSSGIIFGPSSIGSPSPSKTLPIMSGETPSSSGFPKNLTLVSIKLIPLEPSNI